jgi:hypothetical protein
MMGELSPQGNLFSGAQMHLDYVGRDSFYGWLATEGSRVFPDSAFKAFYVLDNGRKSVPPSQMIRLVLLQWFDKTSDFETVERAKFDLRWKVALRLEDHSGLCAKFTLQTFRGRLLLNEAGRDLLRRSVVACREAGVLQSRKVRAAIDTSPIIGRGAVKDTYNLVADGMVKLLRALAAFDTPLLQPVDVEAFAQAHDLSRYLTDGSIKGDADLNWDDESERVAFLTGLVVDVRRAFGLAKTLMASVDPAQAGMRCGSADAITQAVTLLEQLVQQDIEVREDGQSRLKQGVAKDRIVSVHDPEMRHGRKSKRTRFDGHKGEVVVDVESGTILDASIKAGNAHDADGSLDTIERAEQTLEAAWEQAPAKAEGANDNANDGAHEGRHENAHEDAYEVGIDETQGDCAYGSANNRRDFIDAERTLVAKQPMLHNGGRYTKDDFPVDESTGARTCPAGHTTMPKLRTRTWRDEKVKVRFYRWPATTCDACPYKDQCLAPPKDDGTPMRPRGRTISEHPEEKLLVQARAQQHTPKFRDHYRQRQTVEHRLARMMQLGARQARYFGRAKTQLQWLIAATVANLTLAISHRSPETRQEQTVHGPQTLRKALKALSHYTKTIWESRRSGRSRSANRHQTICIA